MHALIIDRQASRLDHSLISLMEAGVYVTGTASIQVAEICISRMAVDLLVIEKSAVGTAFGDLLGAAEDRNPQLVSILRSPDVGVDHDLLTPHFRSLHCVLGDDVSNTFAVQLGIASLRDQINLSTDDQTNAVPPHGPDSLMPPTPVATHAPAPLDAYAVAS